MSKSCAFCSFVTDDEAVFKEHVAGVHGWGNAASVARSATRSPQADTIYCYGCHRPNTRRAAACRYCFAPLAPSDAAERLGQTYLLNRLVDLQARGFLTGDRADAIRAELLASLGIPSVPPERPAVRAPEVGERVVEPAVEAAVAPVVAPMPAATASRPSKPRQPTGPGLLSPERAPSLLLYVGAFLIVVAALIFVGVSGQQIAGETKLVMLIAGTIAFLVVALLCHRSARVIEAGRTFLVIGALLVPLDFAAYYLLITNAALSFDVVWTLGWLVSAGLYATLASTGYGRLYSYFFLPAAIATVAGIEMVVDLPGAWALIPIAVLCLVLDYADAAAAIDPLRRLTRPIARASRYVGSFVLGVTIVLAPLTSDRRSIMAALAIAGVYYAWRAPRGTTWERWAAATAPAGVAISLVYVLHAPSQTHGFVLALLALAYGIAGDVAGLGAPVRTAPWLAAIFERIAAIALVLALVPVDGYWKAPFVGAFVGIAMAGGLATVAMRRSARWPWVPTLVYCAALLLHAGVLALAIALGLVHAGLAPLSGLVGREVALVVAPLAVLLGLATAYAARRLSHLATSVALSALASAAVAVAFAFADRPLATALAFTACAGVVLASIVDRRPRGLWIALVFAGAGAIALDLWLSPAVEVRPLALTGAALVLFIPAYLSRFAASALARTTREIALAVAAAGVIIGYASLADARLPGIPTFSQTLWLATVPVVLAFGALAVAEGLRRRSEETILAGTCFFLGAVLMLIARARPGIVEAYTIPVALYLTLVAWGLAHWRARRDRDLGMPAAAGAALALIVPTYVGAWTNSDVTRAVVVLGESLVLLRFAADRGHHVLANVSLLGLAGVLLLSGTAPLAFESATALFGSLGIGLAIAVPRFITWRLDTRSRELTELVSALLVLVPPVVRATMRGSDALDQGASALAAAVVIVAIALWSGRRALLAVGLATIAFVGVLALPEAVRAEPYVTAAALALVLLALSIPRYLPRRLPLSHESALQVTAGALLLSSVTQRTYTAGGEAAIRLIVECLALIACGLVARRVMLSYAGIGGAGLAAIWIMSAPDDREFYGIVFGAALVAVGLTAARYAPRVLDQRALMALETGGALLFIAPTLISGWADDFFPRTPMVFLEILLLLGLGVVMHRRWLAAPAVLAFGLEAVRGLIDTINRLPNYVLFAASGALLLAVGFVLLLKREAWHAWSERAVRWWTRI